MGQHYGHLSVCERNFLQSSLNKERSRSWVAGVLGRSRSTIWREVKRWGADCGAYDAAGAGAAARARQRRGLVKLREGTALRSHVFAQIRLGWSPQQICGRLNQMRDSGAPGLPGLSHETVYRAVYILPRGEIRREIIGLLRHAKSRRGPRNAELEKRGGLIDMISIHDRPAEALTRQFPGDWEGDFIKGKGNASAVGTLIERKSRFTILAKMADCGSEAALKGFTKALAKVPQSMRNSLAYDQGKEMARHKELAKALNIIVYFCDPHSPWQRPGNENTNGLVRQYLPKGIDLSLYPQSDLNKIADSLNSRPRKCLGFQTPQEVFMQEYLKTDVALQL